MSDRAAQLLDTNSPLGATFQSRVAQARARYPELRVELTLFAEHVAAVCPALTPAEADSLGELCVTDLYLAHACATGDPAALELFDAGQLRALRSFVPEIDASAARLDELRQLLRERLLLGTPEQPARIQRYAGRGPLRAWVQVAAQRLALSALRRRLPQTLSADALLLERMAPDPDPELAQLRLRYAEEFQAALRAALKQLPARERLLLRLHLVDGLSLTRIAASYRVSQSTVSRWFAQARELVRDETQRRLRESSGVDSAEFDSLARALRSQLDVSLSRLLRSSNSASAPEPGSEA